MVGAGLQMAGSPSQDQKRRREKHGAPHKIQVERGPQREDLFRGGGEGLRLILFPTILTRGGSGEPRFPRQRGQDARMDIVAGRSASGGTGR